LGVEIEIKKNIVFGYGKFPNTNTFLLGHFVEIHKSIERKKNVCRRLESNPQH
jgi:hypothetical protein